MRNTIYVLMLLACGPRGVVTDDKGTDGDADTDADSDADADSDTDADADTGLGGGDCAAGPATTGPWDDHPITVDGAPVTATPYSNDAGVDDVIAAAQGQYDPVAVNIPVTEVTIVAKGYVPANPTDNTLQFWVEDANGAVVAWYVDVGMDPNLVKVGDKVSFTATEVEEYFGTIEITAITGFTIVSSSNPVHVVDVMSTGAPLTFADHGNRVAEVWGELVSGPEDCSANCFEFQYGSNTATFRTESTFDVVGDCIHYIGPVGQFDGAVQLNASDFDWYTYY
jgi:hypothetical protein